MLASLPVNDAGKESGCVAVTFFAGAAAVFTGKGRDPAGKVGRRWLGICKCDR